MAKKSKAAKAAAAAAAEAVSSTPPASLTSTTPKQQQQAPTYTATVGVHATLLIFTVLFLPQAVTPTLHDFLSFGSNSSSEPQQPQPSADRPQHPFLDALTLDPVATLLCVCAGAAVVQAWWGGLVRGWGVDHELRRAESLRGGSRQEGGKTAADEKADETQRRIAGAKVEGRKFVNLLTAILTTAAFALLFFLVLVLFGAPLLTHIPHTFLLALLLSLLAVFPAAYALGAPWATTTAWFDWVRVFGEFNPHTPHERALLYPALGALGGAWAGALPLALDWGRGWQTYPLPPLFGALAGHVLASLAALGVSGIRAVAAVGVREAGRDKPQ
ncbi:GPI biosynthesis protein family Pig-F-domain-containing protein [Mycena filopes]|nr:GPI biosynthesis protein family Pig-F-domain-containing protein [Mycena filopes]